MDTENKMKNALESVKSRLGSIRAGRANPALLNGIMVSYYGTPTPIQSIANIMVPEARQLLIKPFDKNAVKDIEKAINEANLGINPTNNGEMVILTIPELTMDRRKEYVKQAKGIAEDAKIALRNIRQDANNDKKKLEIPEDDIKSGMDEVQELINKYNKIVDEKAKIKENELMSV